MKQILILSLFLGSFNALLAQTRVEVPIQTEDAFKVLIWAFDENVNKWRWADLYETGIEKKYGWMYEQRLTIEVDRYDVFDALFIRGFEDCRDTTRLTIYGSFEKEKIKDKEELRKIFKVNGEHQYFGTKIIRPQ